MRPMSMEFMIARLLGRAETGTLDQSALSHEDRQALAQRLRDLLDEGSQGASGTDRGPAAEAAQLAAYLDGAMDSEERAAFERELLQSPQRRDELLSTAAWLDELAARPETPPADATELAMALGTPVSQPARRRGIAAFLESLLPRQRFAVASALAAVLIAVVGVDIAVRMTSQVGVPSVQYGERTALPSPGDPLRTWQGSSNRIVLTAETINALVAYRDNPEEPQRQALVRTLNRAGAAAFDNRNVRSITLQPRLVELLNNRSGPLPARLSAELAPDGTLTLDRAD